MRVLVWDKVDGFGFGGLLPVDAEGEEAIKTGEDEPLRKYMGKLHYEPTPSDNVFEFTGSEGIEWSGYQYVVYLGPIGLVALHDRVQLAAFLVYVSPLMTAGVLALLMDTLLTRLEEETDSMLLS